METSNGQIKIAVLRGGVSSECKISLEAGKYVLDNLDEDKYRIIDIFIDKEGVWHLKGLPILPENLLNQIDIVFNTLYGQFGEDGKIQDILEAFSVPYIGSGVLASAITANKELAKKIILKENSGFFMPLGYEIKIDKDLDRQIMEAFQKIPSPWIIKTRNGGSSLGVSLVKDFHNLTSEIVRGLENNESILVEEYINGREFFCGVVSGFRGEENYLLPIFEIFKKGEYLDYTSKLNGQYEIELAKLSKKQKDKIRQIVLGLTEQLKLKSYAEFKFILSSQALYLVEINTLPKLTSQSSFIKALDLIGAKPSDFIDHLIEDALKN